MRRKRIKHLVALTGGLLAAGTLMAPQALAASAVPDTSAAAASINAPATPGPWPPAIPPPHCVPEDQSPDGSKYEWQYMGSKKLGTSIAYEYAISYAVPVANWFTLSQKVTCSVDAETGRAGSGLSLNR
jgi:hypothetical protein